MNKKIKSTRVTYRHQYIERADAPELREMSFVSEERQYDEQERLLSMVKFTRPDVLEEKVVKSYDANHVTTEYYIDEKEISEKTVDELDDKGRISKQTIYYADGTESVVDFEYEGDRIVKQTTFDIDEYEREISGVHSWQYDAKGNLLKEEEYEYDELSFSREIAYDNDERMLTRRVFHAADLRPSFEEFEWTGDVVTHSTMTDVTGAKSENFFTLNDKQQVHELRYQSDNSITTTLFEYDEKDHVVHERETDESGEVMYEVFRQYDAESGLLRRQETYINRRGQSPDVHYVMEYEYTFY
jgi:hypothetical protein